MEDDDRPLSDLTDYWQWQQFQEKNHDTTWQETDNN